MNVKRILFVFLGLFVLMSIESCDAFMGRRQRCIGRIIDNTMKELSSEGLAYVGTGVRSGFSPDYWVEHLELVVITDQALDQETGRALAIRAARELRDQINSVGCAEVLFQSLPVGPESVNVTITTSKHDTPHVYAPFFQAVLFCEGKVLFWGKVSEESRGFDYEYEETLEEALQKLGEEQF